MTLAEKAGQLTQYFYLKLPATAETDPALGLYVDEQPRMVEKALGRGQAGSLLFVTEPSEVNRLQRLAVEGHRLGIPLLFGFDVIHGLRIIFPVPIAMAASWDLDTIERGQAVAAREARTVGIHWAFAPMVDIARDPRWGRIIEGGGEDPFLGAAVAAARVRGQGADFALPDRVIAGPKHFAGYRAALGGRDYDEVNLSEYELWNVYFPPFRAAVEAGAGNVMTAYMNLNGVPASGSRWLFTEVLRETWGFDEFVVSDANAVRNPLTHGFAADFTDAGARAVTAGCAVLPPASSSASPCRSTAATPLADLSALESTEPNKSRPRPVRRPPHRHPCPQAPAHSRQPASRPSRSSRRDPHPHHRRRPNRHRRAGRQPTAQDLAGRLPLTLTFRDFNQVEKIAELPQPLTMDGVPDGDDPEINDIGYYAPSRSLVFYYGDVGYWSGIVRIGRLSASDMDLIERQPDGFDVTIDKAP